MLDFLARLLAGKAAGDLTQARFAFGAPWSATASWGLLIGVFLAIFLFSWMLHKPLRALPRAGLSLLRATLGALALFLLLDPCLIGERFRPGQRHALLLFDDTQSMQIVGADGATRGERMRQLYEQSRALFEDRLREKCELIFCRFGSDIERIRGLQDLDFQLSESDPATALERATREFDPADVAAIVLFSDGARQTQEPETDWETPGRLDAPALVVGVSETGPWRDLAIEGCSIKQAPFDGAPVAVSALARASGLEGREAVFEAALDGKVLASRSLVIPSGEWQGEVRLEFALDAPGWQSPDLRARLADAEETAEDRAPANNARALLLDNREKQYHILFLCGRPNWENAFIRRAAEMDRQLKLTSLVRVSGKEREFKYRGDRSSLANPLFEGFDASRELPRYDESVFIRLGAEEQELIGGYPDRLEDLFPYHLIVWSEIEAEFFSLGQMEATRDYVRQRGGALLLLGGPRSLGQGGYAGTPIEALLPARLLADSSLPPDPALQPFQADPALEGLASGVWSLDLDPEKNASLWKEGPALYGLNPLALIRPGAAMAARASSQSRALDGLPLFVSQRYGLGRGAILASYATWPWRMGVEPEDERHERFWRQLARSLCRETPDAIEARGKQDSYPVGAPVRLEFLVRDRRFESREGLEATAIVRGPGGEILAAAVEESIEESGVYAVEFAPEAPGAYRIEFAPGTTENPPAREEAILATPDRREFDNARYDPEYLRRLARAVGGEFVPLEELGGAFEKIPWRPSQQAEYGRARLWSWPGFYLVLAALALAEWLWRRRRGQA